MTRLRLQDPPARPESALPDHVEDGIHPLSGPGEVLALVVDDALGAEPSHQLDVRGGRGGDDVHTEVDEQLDRRRADRAGRAVDEHPLPRPDPARRMPDRA